MKIINKGIREELSKVPVGRLFIGTSSFDSKNVIQYLGVKAQPLEIDVEPYIVLSKITTTDNRPKFYKVNDFENSPYVFTLPESVCIVPSLCPNDIGLRKMRTNLPIGCVYVVNEKYYLSFVHEISDKKQHEMFIDLESGEICTSKIGDNAIAISAWKIVNQNRQADEMLYEFKI